MEAVEQVCTRSELDQNLSVFLVKQERDIITLPEVVLNLWSNKHNDKTSSMSLTYLSGENYSYDLHDNGTTTDFIYYYETSQNDQKRWLNLFCNMVKWRGRKSVVTWRNRETCKH